MKKRDTMYLFIHFFPVYFNLKFSLHVRNIRLFFVLNKDFLVEAKLILVYIKSFSLLCGGRFFFSITFMQAHNFVQNVANCV